MDDKTKLLGDDQFNSRNNKRKPQTDIKFHLYSTNNKRKPQSHI